MGLVRYGKLIGVHGSATVSVQGTFEFGAGVSIARDSLIQVPRNSMLSLGDGVRVGREVEISASPRITIGNDTSVQDRCILLGELSIGGHCLFAPNVMMSSATHHFRDRPAWLIRDQDRLLEDSTYQPVDARSVPISVEDDCWIGINAVLMRGVTIGRGSIVGANSVVTKSVAPYSVVAGVPARVVGRRLEFNPPRAISAVSPADLPYFYSGFDLRQRNLAALGGARACGAFRVALDCRGSRLVRIELAAERPVSLRFSGQQLTLPAGRHSASFTLEQPDAELFMAFEASSQDGRPCPVTVFGASAQG
jgi:acetyltransferase-like isoleucine patch superfamily enzyme